MARSAWLGLAALGLVVGCGSEVNTLFGTTSSGEGGQGASGGGGAATGGEGGTTSGTGGGTGGGGPCGVDCSQIGAPMCKVSACNVQIGQCEIVDDEDGTECDDGLMCTVGDQCIAGTCVAGTEDPCDITPAQCHDVLCNEQNQTCEEVPLPNGTTCTSTDLCLLNTTCQNGTCEGTLNDCSGVPVPDVCHEAVCNPSNGQCELQPGNNGAPCVNPNAPCMVNQTCAGGVCQGGQPKNCSYLDQGCQVGVCNNQNGQCTTQNAPQGTPCQDSIACTTGETCSWGGVCTGGTYITQCISGDQCCPPGCTGNTDNDCGTSQIVLAAVERGWWRDDGDHTATNDNTLTGFFNGTGYTHNSYFIFDLSGVTGTVIAAELQLEVDDYTSPDPTETVSFWDVSTPAVTLEATGTGQTQIYNDLMSGHAYGSWPFQPSDEGTVVTIALDAQGVVDINAALGGFFSVGGHAATVSGGASQWVRFSMQAEPRIHYLVLTLL